MRVFFLDDAGNRSAKSQERYFALGGFSVDADEIHLLREVQSQLWELHGGLGAPGDEIKFSHVGSIRNRPAKPNPLVREGLSREERREFIMEALSSLVKIPSIEVIVAVVDKKYSFGQPPFLHGLTVLSERVQKSLEEKGHRGMLICDEENTAHGAMRELFHTGGTEYVSFTNLLETISFVPSKWSPGIQMADIIVGSVARALNYDDYGYFDIIRPILRTSPTGKAWKGFGVAVFPNKEWPFKNKRPGENVILNEAIRTSPGQGNIISPF